MLCGGEDARTYPAAARLAEQIHRLSTESTNRRESRVGRHLKLTDENSDTTVCQLLVVVSSQLHAAHALSLTDAVDGENFKGPVWLILIEYMFGLLLRPRRWMQYFVSEVQWTVERYYIPEDLTKA
jgi:hypothetical protein